MKKTLLLKTMLLLFGLIVGSTSAWAEKVTFDATTDITENSSGTGYQTTEISYTASDNSVWKANGYIATANTQIQIGKGGANYLETPNISGTITSVEVTWSGNTSYYLALQTTSGTELDAKNNTSTPSTQTFSVTGSYSQLRLVGRRASGTSNAAAYITKVVVTYTPSAPAYTINALSNNESYGTVSLSGSVITATPAAGYTYANPAYTVNPANSATVSQNGNEFTITPSANTTVTINFEEIPKYTVTLGDDNSTLTETTAGAGVTLPTRSAIGEYTFAGWCETNVSTETTTAPTIISTGAYAPTQDITLYPVYTRTGGSGTTPKSASVTISEYATAHSWENATQYESVTLDENITATADGGANTGKYYTTGNGSWRIYSSEQGTLNLNAANGAEFTSATITFSNSTLSYGGSNITSGTAVSLSGTSAEFTPGGTTYITAISVNYEIAGTTYYWSSPVPPAVATPEIAVADNPFLFSTTATITCATEGATIKYSYDGENWNDYSAELTITETKTIYAKASKGEDVSSVAQVTATKNLAEATVTVSGDLTLDLNGETNVNAGTLTAAVTYNDAPVAGATVTWSGNNDAVATIDASTGAVTLLTTGEVTFTATYAGNSDYAEATGTKTVTIVDSNAPGTENNPYTVAQARAAIDAGAGITGVYATGIVSKIVTAYNSEHGNISYNISADGLTTSEQLQAYRGKSYNGNNFTSEDDIQVGDIVVIKGNLTKYGSTYEFAADNQLVSLVRPVTPIIGIFTAS